jgi:hypothetical protein
LLLFVLPLAITRYISSWERDGYQSNSWWGGLGWLTGAFISGVMLMPFLWFLPLYVLFIYLVYTPVWGLATAKIINGIVIKASWYPGGIRKALVGAGVGLFVGTFLSILGSYVHQDPPIIIAIMLIVGMGAGGGAGFLSRPYESEPYD